VGVPVDPKESPERREVGVSPDLLVDGRLPDIRGLYARDVPSVNAIFISHYHEDHWGLIPLVHPEIPLYMTRGTKIFIGATCYFRGVDFRQNVCEMEEGESLSVGDFTVTPIGVDHSATAGCALLIEGGGKRIFYTGDFRAHGRRSYLFERLLEVPPAGVDCLIIEGTHVTGDFDGPKMEEEVEEKLMEIFNGEGPFLIGFSAYNVDRLVSVYKACRRTRKTFVWDPYTAFVMDRAKSISPSLPQAVWRNVRVYFLKHTYTDRLASDGLLWNFKGRKIRKEELKNSRKDLVIKDSLYMRRALVREGILRGGTYVHTMWKGYLTEEMKRIFDVEGVKIIHAHTSGHANRDDLKKLIDAISPRVLIPVHTENPEEFTNIVSSEVIVPKTGQKVMI